MLDRTFFTVINSWGRDERGPILRCKEIIKMKPFKEGKVREIYDNGDSLIMVATDRISCFDVILNNTVTGY